MKSLSFVCLILNLILSFPNTLLAQSPPTPQPSPNSETLPSVPKDPPPLPKPKNKTRPGGGLTQEFDTCQAQEGQLTVLIPESNDPHPPLTLAAPFTLLLYFPDDASHVEKIEFWINSEDEKVRIFPKQLIPLPNQSGIISITFSKDLSNILEDGKNYHWYLKVSCQNQTTLEVNGWLQKVDNFSENRWYDLLASLAKQRHQNPDNPTVKLEWKEFLEQIDAGNLADQPIYFMDLNEKKLSDNG